MNGPLGEGRQPRPEDLVQGFRLGLPRRALIVSLPALAAAACGGNEQATGPVSTVPPSTEQRATATAGAFDPLSTLYNSPDFAKLMATPQADPATKAFVDKSVVSTAQRSPDNLNLPPLERFTSPQFPYEMMAPRWNYTKGARIRDYDFGAPQDYFMTDDPKLKREVIVSNEAVPAHITTPTYGDNFRRQIREAYRVEPTVTAIQITAKNGGKINGQRYSILLGGSTIEVGLFVEQNQGWRVVVNDVIHVPGDKPDPVPTAKLFEQLITSFKLLR